MDKKQLQLQQTQIEQGESSESANLICNNNQKSDHYTNRCPNKSDKQSDWDAQDEMRKAAKVWVKKANNENVDWMQHEMQNIAIDKPQLEQQSLMADEPMVEGSTW